MISILDGVINLIRAASTEKHTQAEIAIGKDYESNTQLSMDIASAWLQCCRSSHKHCNRKCSKVLAPWYPTRVIDIDTGKPKEWKLCITTDNASKHSYQPYLTLSYRWSLQPALLLLSSTIGRFQKGQSVQILPKTFQDFIVVAKAFRVRYICIDALCIIQDSKKDWESEAVQMHNVYANSACTIAAIASSDEFGGLFRSRQIHRVQPGLMSLSLLSGELQACQVFERDYWNKQILQGPLHKRGWVFQERHLSPRVFISANTKFYGNALTARNVRLFRRVYHSIGQTKILISYESTKVKWPTRRQRTSPECQEIYTSCGEILSRTMSIAPSPRLRTS